MADRTAVREWALRNGWQRSERSPHLFRDRDGSSYRLQLGDGALREQIWTPRDYAPRVKGFWKNVVSCPWGSVRVEDGALIRLKNNCREFGAKKAV